MKKLLATLLAGAFLAGCVTDEERQPVFVTGVEIPAGETFAPGEEVTVRAEGFEENDDLMLDIRWPLPDQPIQQGYARGIYAVVTGQTASVISFLAPGGYPASTVEVLLLRQGRMQSLGKIAVTDGQPPRRAILYGIVNSPTGSAIDRIDPATGDAVRIADFGTESDLRCAVCGPGQNRIYGVSDTNGGRLGMFYDLTMRYLRDSDPEHYLVPGVVGTSAAYLRCEGDRLYLTSMNRTRTSPVVPPSWQLPDGLEPSMLAERPFVLGPEGTLLFAANRGDGTYCPVVLCAGIGTPRVLVGEPTACDAMIPFRMIRSLEVDGQKRDCPVAGYLLSDTESGRSELRLFDPESMTFDEPFAVLDVPVRSLAVDYDSAAQEIYCLAERPGGMQIEVYNWLEKSWRTLPGRDYPCAEIVLAR